MKNIIISISIISFSFLVISCDNFILNKRKYKNIEKDIKDKNYYEKVIKISNFLLKNPTNKKAVQQLNLDYYNAIKEQERKILIAKSTSKSIYMNEMEKLSTLYKSILKLNTKTKNLFIFKITYQELFDLNNKISSLFYEMAESYFPRENILDYKIISKLYKKSYDYNNFNTDAYNKYKKFKNLSKRNIQYFEINYEYNNFNIGKFLSKNILDLLNKDFLLTENNNFINSQFLYNNKNNILSSDFSNEVPSDKNYLLDFNITKINFFAPITSIKEENLVWYEVKRNINGELITEYLLYNPILYASDNHSIYYEKKYTKIHKYKEVSAEIFINFSLIDLKTKNIIKSGILSSSLKDFQTSIILEGEVYPEEFPILEKKILSDFDILKKLSQEISIKLKNEITDILI